MMTFSYREAIQVGPALIASLVQSGKVSFQPKVRAKSEKRVVRGSAIGVLRADFPAGPEGQRLYNIEYMRRRRAIDQPVKRERVVQISARDFPNTPEGRKEYRRQYRAAYYALHHNAA